MLASPSPDLDAAIAELRAKGADVAIGPLTRDAGTYLAFIRGPEGIMVELVQTRVALADVPTGYGMGIMNGFWHLKRRGDCV